VKKRVIAELYQLAGSPQPLNFDRKRSAFSAKATGLATFALMITSLSGCHTPHFGREPTGGCDCYPLLGDVCGNCTPLIGHGFPRPPGNLLGRLHHNSIIAQKIAEHKEAKAAPPWPHFHPLPTRPALYPEPASQDALHPGIYGEFESSEY
jgi:hypothetical protein